MSHHETEVVITGCGWVTPFASGTVRDVLSALSTSNVAAANAPPATPTPGNNGFLPVPDATMQAFANISKEIRQDKGAWMTAVAVEYAFEDAGLDRTTIAPERLGMVLGCALAGQTGMIQFAGEVREQSARFVSPINFPQTVGNFIAGAIARAYNVRGPNLTLAAGTASGLDAVCEATALLRSNRADIILAGGTEALTNTLATALCGTGFQPVRVPQDDAKPQPATGGMAKRSAAMLSPDGFLAEGACWFILERAVDAAKRGARIHATIRTWTHRHTGSSQEVPDPCHPAQPSPIVSTAGLRLPAADHIQDRIGFAPGAAGASALAAAIGATTESSLPSSLTTGGPRRVPTRVRILAGDDHSHLTSLEVDLPTP